MRGNFGIPENKNSFESMDELRDGIKDIERQLQEWAEKAAQTDGVDTYWFMQGRTDMTKALMVIGRSIGL